MVHSVRLVVMEVLEVGGIRMTKIEGQEGVAIIDCVQFLSIHELLNVVLNNWGLVDSSSLSSSSVHTNAITESENVLEALMLKSVRIYINDTLVISDLRGEKLLVGLARRVNHSSEEVLLNDIPCVNIAEGGDLLTVLVGGNLDHFPAEEDLDASLSALLESNLISVRELEDLLVGGPVLNTGVLSCTSL
jgi:hypothetical protein